MVVRQTLEKTILKNVNAFEMTQMKCYRQILKIAWTEHRTNKFIREELQREEQWMENFVRRQKLKCFGHQKRSKGLGNPGRKDRREKRKWNETKNVMAKRYSGRFQRQK